MGQLQSPAQSQKEMSLQCREHSAQVSALVSKFLPVVAVDNRFVLVFEGLEDRIERQADSVEVFPRLMERQMFVAKPPLLM